MLQLHTTRSWDFMGLSLHLKMEQPSSQMHLKYGDDVIVGILDTGTCHLTILHPCKSCCTFLYLLLHLHTWKVDCLNACSSSLNKICSYHIITMWCPTSMHRIYFEQTWKWNLKSFPGCWHALPRFEVNNFILACTDIGKKVSYLKEKSIRLSF